MCCIYNIQIYGETTLIKNEVININVLIFSNLQRMKNIGFDNSKWKFSTI